MSLKNDYLTGPSGLEQSIAEAFAAGVAFVGTGAADVESLYLGDRNGANLATGVKYTFTVSSANATAGAVYSNNGAQFTVNTTIASGLTLVTTGTGSGVPSTSGTLTLVSGTGDSTITFSAVAALANMGTYFQIFGPSGAYAVWIYVNGEQVPVVPGFTPIQVTLLTSDTSSQAATKIAAAITAIPTLDFTTMTIGGSIETTASTPKAVSPLTLGAGNWGTAVAAVVKAGITPTGNYLTISNALKAFAQMGRTEFKMCLPASCPPNSNVLRANHGNNLILKAYFAGIVNAFANEAIYSYEVRCVLNVSDKAVTNVELVFNFSYNQKTHHDISYELPPYRQPFED